MTQEMLRLLEAQRRRKKDALLSIDRAWKLNAQQMRLASRRLRRLEGELALTTPQTIKQPAAPEAEPQPGETQLEALSRRMAAMQQDIRQYQTRLFACERAILALQKENAELEAMCERARALGFDPGTDSTPAGPFWPDEPSEEAAPEGAEAQDSPVEAPQPAWLDAPMELLDPPEGPPPAGNAALDEMLSQVLDSLDQLMEREHIPLQKSAYIED